MKRLILPLAFMIGCVVLVVLIATADASAHYKPGTHNAVHAIQQVWCGKSNRECDKGNEAISVAKCEAAQYWSLGIPHLAVGPNDELGNPRLSMFQMGTRERRLYGHGPDPWRQAKAAYRYYVSSGRDWSPWECKP